MTRNDFLRLIALTTIGGQTMTLQTLSNISKKLQVSDKMPVFFIGHGSPMNAVEDNEFSLGWAKAVENIPRPKAILCISAHWETSGTLVTAMSKPKTIHDFGGFPRKLYEVQYPAHGNPELANEISSLGNGALIKPDNDWGLDHGTWSILRRMFPKADIPVLQLSLDYNISPEKHYELAALITSLRQRGVLIVGSGNIVHNLGRIDWSLPESGTDWAESANLKMKNLIEHRDDKSLIGYSNLGSDVRLSIPTAEHYLPMIYILGMAGKNEDIKFFNDKCVYGSLSMTSFRIN